MIRRVDSSGIAYNLSCLGSQVQDLPRLQNELKANLGNLAGSCLKKLNKQEDQKSRGRSMHETSSSVPSIAIKSF